MNPIFLRALPAIGAAIALQFAGCAMVSQEAYDRDLAGMRQQQDWLEAQKKAQDGELQVCNGKLKTAVDGLQTCTRQKELSADELASIKKALEQCTTRGGSAARDLATCQIDKDKMDVERRGLKAERDHLAGQLKTLQDRLNKVEAGIAQVRQRLQKLVDGGKLRVKIANGFLVIEVSSDILFDTGKSDIKAAAKPVLAELAAALKELADRRFQIAGHTDNTGPAALNWRLSVARSIAVVEELVGDGLDPNHLSAGGYGPYLPVASNDGDDGKQKNRRVEILLMPDLSELLNLAK